MKLIIENHSFQYETENLCKIFFPSVKIETIFNASFEDGIYTGVCETENGFEITVGYNIDGSSRTSKAFAPLETAPKELERILAVTLYKLLEEFTGFSSKWGILTGIRPVKLVREWHEQGMNDEEIRKTLTEKYLVSHQKTDLLLRTEKNEQAILGLSNTDSYSLYVSIPFCPTRCSYCSFVSHAINKAKKLIPEYLVLLCKELEYTAKIAKDIGLRLETVYIGGGTPTTLNAEELRTLIDCIEKNYDTKNVREFTIEAGRPDTIDADKLRVIKNSTVTRISINPQTLNDDVLCEIGRKHTAQQCLDSFDLARREGVDNINMDLIAGLPTDTLESFESTLEKILSLSPENITLHTLSVKRAADLRDEGAKIHAASEGVASKMVDYAYDRFIENGYEPYYLYRQKNMLESLENVGYAKRGYEGLYNVYIMDETHTILAVGAGAVTKLKNHETDKLERIFNFKFPYEYISRYDEIIQRKELVYDFYREG